ncbi:MAG: sigma-70 family RNA polymerase sigma factor [Clostridia bacterium]|nr:sigma-70 family RNA polymerase sigma factor [Clostridia bacterium]
MLPHINEQLTELDDTALCALVCGGNEPAFEEISHRYKGLIRLISKEYSYPGFDSGDFMQLGLMGLYSACKTYQSDKSISFKNFAAVCIRRRFISLVRSLLNQKSVPADALVSIDEVESSGSASDPEDLLLDKENDKLFYELIKGRLSYMEMCALKGYVSGLSYSEIAQSTGLDVKAVDNALQRVRKKLLK